MSESVRAYFTKVSADSDFCQGVSNGVVEKS